VVEKLKGGEERRDEVQLRSSLHSMKVKIGRSTHDTVASVHSVRLSVVDDDPVGVLRMNPKKASELGGKGERNGFVEEPKGESRRLTSLATP